jgi:hypothetical protein
LVSLITPSALPKAPWKNKTNGTLRAPAGVIRQNGLN